MKYLSCPLCGTPEPDIISNVATHAVEVWIFHCMNCNKTIRVEDVSNEFDEEDLKEMQK